jgi:hypothetical protein
MSGLEIVGLALGVVPLLVETVKNPGLLSDFINYHFLDDWSNLDTQTRRRKKIIAKLRTSLLQACFPSVWHQITIIEKNVLPGDDEVAEQFRLSYVSDCNMSAVAVCGLVLSFLPSCLSSSGCISIYIYISANFRTFPRAIGSNHSASSNYQPVIAKHQSDPLGCEGFLHHQPDLRMFCRLLRLLVTEDDWHVVQG